MDPNEALYQLLLALHDAESDNAREDAIAYLEDLTAWLENDGAMPNVEAVLDKLFENAAEEEDEEAVDESEAPLDFESEDV